MLVGPGLGHQAQLTVEVRNLDSRLALALFIERYRKALLGNDGDRGVGAFAALGHGRVAAECQARQTALPGLDQLAVDIQLVGTVGLAAEQAGERVRGLEIGDVEDAHVHRRQQHMHLFRHAAIGVGGLEFHGQRLLGAHLLRGLQGQSELAFGTVQRQMQYTHGALWRGVGLAFAGADHQGADVQVVTRPLFIQLHVEGLALGGHVDLLPPQRAIAGFDHQITAAGSRWGDRDLGGGPVGIGRFVQGQLDWSGRTAPPSALSWAR